MKWIIVAIIAVVVQYTFLTLHYRKPGPAFQPYADMKNRANVARLLAAGYQRIPLGPQSTGALPTTGGAAVSAAPGGLPDDLRSTLVEPPPLAAEIVDLSAASVTGAAQMYVLRFACTPPGDHLRLAGAELYLRGEKLVFVPTFEPVSASATRSTAVTLAVPAGILKPGRYDALVVGERASRAWSVDVR